MLSPNSRRLALEVVAVGALFLIGSIGARWWWSASAARAHEPTCGIGVSTAADDGMVLIHGGPFRMGDTEHYAEEGPVKPVSVGDFWISSHDVTNAQFAAFVAQTGYVTVAEHGVDPQAYPQAPADWLTPGGAVFRMPTQPPPGQPLRWWNYVPGANWRHPAGPDSDIDGLDHHPVVQVAFEDAQAYARWAHADLPTEAQWEFAADGGIDGKPHPWGTQLNPDGHPMANTWQGEFPLSNTRADGFAGTSPVGCFPANGYGLYDMIGNVWQWTRDWYFPGHDEHASNAQTLQAASSSRSNSSFDPDNPDVPSRVIKGGSFLCSSNYCVRYRPAARQPHDAGLGTNHIGFRIVRSLGDNTAAVHPSASAD